MCPTPRGESVGLSTLHRRLSALVVCCGLEVKTLLAVKMYNKHDTVSTGERNRERAREREGERGERERASVVICNTVDDVSVRNHASAMSDNVKVGTENWAIRWRNSYNFYMAFPVAIRQVHDVCGGTPDCLVPWSQHDGRPTQGVIDFVIMPI